jgi:hypothetical protein
MMAGFMMFILATPVTILDRGGIQNEGIFPVGSLLFGFENGILEDLILAKFGITRLNTQTS